MNIRVSVAIVFWLIATPTFIFWSLSSAVAGQTELDQIRIKYQLPALAVSVIKGDGTTTYVSGVRKWGDPTLAQSSDKFHLGSNTKAMTATVLAIYIERGLLKWDSTLGELLSDIVPDMQDAFQNISVEMLTAHRSGITGDLIAFQNGKLWQELRDPSLDPVKGRRLTTQALLSSPPASVPGSQYEYSNGNYVIAGAILEKLTGKSWEVLMEEELFKPLGMTSCGFGVQADPNANPPDQPWPHAGISDGPVPLIPDIRADNPSTIGPAGTIHCSIKDWGQFAKLHRDGFNGLPTSILSVNSFKKLHEAYPHQVYTYGGWMRLDRPWAGGPVLFHGGSNTANYATLWIAPLKNLILLSMTNMGGDNAAKAMDEATTAMILGLP